MSAHADPIVPTVLYVAEQHYSWKLAAYERLEAKYHTPTTVFLAFGTADSSVKRIVGKKGVVKQQTGVYCLPDDAAWERAQAARAALQLALDEFAAALRQLGSYATRLATAGGIKQAPNPLSPTVILVDDPDEDDRHYFGLDLVPRISREHITSHTPKMLHVERDGKPWSTTHQNDHFVCPDDAAWLVIQERQALAQHAHEAWKQLLRELGTYSTALADGRYKKPVVIPQLDLRGPSFAPAQPPVPNWPAISSPLVYGHHRNASTGGVTHVWQPAPTPRSKQRHETLCHIVMTEPPHRIAPRQSGESGPRLCPECRSRAADIVAAQHKEMTVTTITAPKPADSWHNLPPKLAGWKWEQNQITRQARLLAPDGSWWTNDYRESNKAIAEALRRVNSQPAASLAVVEPAGALSVALQDIARDYVAAREKAGRALLEMASYLALARSLAKHGEWYIFLESTGTSEDQADRLLDIDRKAGENPEYAEAVRRNFLSPTTAALLARPSTPAAVVEQVLRQPTPPTKRQVEQQIQAAKPNPAPVRDLTPAPAMHPDYQHLAAVEKILLTLDQWADSVRPARLQEAYGEARQIRDVTLHNRAMAMVDRAMDAQTAPPPDTRGVRLGPGQPTPEPWPLPPAGWRWNRKGAPAHLIDADGWTTQNYNDPARALAEATQRMRERGAAAVSGAPLIVRPRRPLSADVSAITAYYEQLESYTTKLEQRVAELEQQLALREREVLA